MARQGLLRFKRGAQANAAEQEHERVGLLNEASGCWALAVVLIGQRQQVLCEGREVCLRASANQGRQSVSEGRETAGQEAENRRARVP